MNAYYVAFLIISDLYVSCSWHLNTAYINISHVGVTLLSSVCWVRTLPSGIYWPQIWPLILIASLERLNYKLTKVLGQQRWGRDRQIMQKILKTGCGGRENSLLLSRMLHKWEGTWTTFSDIYIPDGRNSLNQVLGIFTSQAT